MIKYKAYNSAMPTDQATSTKDPVARSRILANAIPREINFKGDNFSLSKIKPPNAVKSGQTMYAKAADWRLTLLTA